MARRLDSNLTKSSTAYRLSGPRKTKDDAYGANWSLGLASRLLVREGAERRQAMDPKKKRTKPPLVRWDDSMIRIS